MQCLYYPRSIYDGETLTCPCGQQSRNSKEVIEHALRCYRFSNIATATRHQFLKTALANTCRSYGITVTVEPNFYAYPDSAVRHRPDLTFWIKNTPVVTDVTIVLPTDDIGTAAIRAANDKVDLHAISAADNGHEFIPFAVENDGKLDSRCTTLFKRIAADVPRRMRTMLFRDLFGSTSTSIAYYRALAVKNACRTPTTMYF